MEHFSVPAVVFSRKKQHRFPQRNEPPSAKTKLFCRKALTTGAERRGKRCFGRLFPLWMESARVQTPFVFLQAIPLAGLTRGTGSGRMAFRGGRQNAAETGFRLSSCIPLGARGLRISVLSRPAPVCAVLAGAALTFCQNVIWNVLLPVGLLAPLRQEATRSGRLHRNRQGSSRGPSFFPSRNRRNIQQLH